MREISTVCCVHMDLCRVCRNRWRECFEPCGELRCFLLLGRKIKICDWKNLRLLESLDISDLIISEGEGNENSQKTMKMCINLGRKNGKQNMTPAHLHRRFNRVRAPRVQDLQNGCWNGAYCIALATPH